MRSTLRTRAPWLLFGLLLLCGSWAASVPSAARAELRGGAAVVDVTPLKLPVLVNGGMVSRSVDSVKTRINARALVLDDGQLRLAIVVVDTCMMPRPLLDDAKKLAAQRTKIAPEHMLIAATHSHTAPSSMACLGTNADPAYVPYLREKLAEVIAAAEANLQPARVGWAVGNAAPLTALRRWIRRPDRVDDDPFGNPTVRANMHAGRVWDDVVGESGPEDPDLSLMAVQTADGRPLAVLANFSMHYFGDQALSADYFGLFCEGMQTRLGADGKSDRPPMVAMMSHGCSGDIWRRDYTKPASSKDKDYTISEYSNALLDVALEAYKRVEYQADADLAMDEARLKLRYRVPDKQRLEWSQRIVRDMGDRLPKTREEIYAREQLILHERQSTEVVVQALRIGRIGIATTPTETYALTGLKIKHQSPLKQTMVLDLTNGGDGYIPPPEQHLFGGYNTWPARSAGLEVQAEPKITETAIQLLENVAGRPRRLFVQSLGETAGRVLAAKPVAYWRLDEFAGPRAKDATAAHRDAFYEPAVAYFLAGPRSESFCGDGEQNRAAHFAGGRLNARLAGLKDQYSISIWFWNGMPRDAREVAGWLASRGPDHGLGPDGDHLGLAGSGKHAGRLVFLHGNDETKLVVGRSPIDRWTWSHAVLVRDGANVRVYLNGAAAPELETRVGKGVPPGFDQWFFGGRSDRASSWEGRLDEIAVFDRALSPADIARLYGTP